MHGRSKHEVVRILLHGGTLAYSEPSQTSEMEVLNGLPGKVGRITKIQRGICLENTFQKISSTDYKNFNTFTRALSSPIFWSD